MRQRGRSLRSRGRPLSGGSSYSPAAIATRNLWLDPGPAYCFTDAAGTVAAGDGDAVYTWRDRGSGAIVCSMSSASARPLLKSSGGKWWLELDGVNNELLFVTNPFSGAAGEIAVVQYNLAGGNIPFWEIGSGSAIGDWWLFGGSVYDSFGSTVCRGPIAVTGGASAVTSPRLYGVAASGSEWSNYLDDSATPLYTTGTNTVGWVGAGSRLAGNSVAGSYPNRRVGEVVGSSAVLAGADRTALYAYLKAKWGTP